jgi:hypothetical protein
MMPGPSVATAAAANSEDRVTCRTSSGSPEKLASSGSRPSMTPSEMLLPKPVMLC